MIKKFAVAALLAAFAVPQAVLAHHSFAMFDHEKEIRLVGVVKEWQWTSPHTWLYLVVPIPGKEPAKYSLEGGNPGLMRRQGFGKGSMSPGDKVTVFMAPLRSGQPGGSINAIVLPDGKTLGERMKAA